MSYLSSFSGPQIDNAIKAVRAGLIDASLFRAKIGELTSSLSGSTSQLSITPLSVDIEGGDPLLIISDAGVYDFYLDLQDGEILEAGATLIPIRDVQGDPIEITAGAGDHLFLQGTALFERFDNISELIEFQNTSISNLGNSILLNNSMGVVGRLASAQQGTLSSLDVSPLGIDLRDGDKLSLLDFESFELVFLEVDGDLAKGATNIPLKSDIEGEFLEDQPISIEGESFVNSISLDRESISLLSASIPSMGSIGKIDGEVSSGVTSIPLESLEADIDSGDGLEIIGPGGELIASVVADSPLDAGGSPLGIINPLSADIPAGSYLHLSTAFLKSKIELSPGQIDLIASQVKQDLELESFVSITPTRVTVETPLMANEAWDGSVNSSGFITSFASADRAWAISNSSNFEFRQDPTHYFRSDETTFEFRGNIVTSQGTVIDDTGFVDNSVPGSSLMPGSVIANKLANNYRRISTDIEFEALIDPQRVRILGSHLSFEGGDVFEVGGTLPVTLEIEPGRNFIYFDTSNSSFNRTGDPDDVFNNSDRVLLALSWRGNISNEEPPTIISGVANNVYGSEVIAAKSISGDKIVANTITGTQIAGASITGDKFQAKTKLVVGEGVSGNPGVIILQGEAGESYRILSGEIKNDIEQNATNANFLLTDKGELIAKQADITGLINAASGSITGNLTVSGALIGPGYYELDNEGLHFEILDEGEQTSRSSITWGDNTYIRGNTVSGITTLSYQGAAHRLRTAQGAFISISDAMNPFSMGSPTEGQCIMQTFQTRINSPEIGMENLPTDEPASPGFLWNDNGTVKIS